MHRHSISKASGIFALSLFSTLLSGTAIAEVIELPGITVVASSLDGEGVDADKVGSSVTVITGKDIERQQVKHVADALRGVPGLHVSRTGGGAGLTQVRMRGAEGNHTLVLIDGVEVNNPTDGEFDFSNLSAENIERIEVIRGPQSGLYGSNALAGVISITTKKGYGPLRVTLKGEAGSFETKSGSVNISGGTEKVYGSLTVDKVKTDGFNIAPTGNEKDGSDRTSIFFRGGFKPIENLTVDVMVRNVAKNGEFDTEVYPPFPIIEPPKVEDANNTLKHDLFMIGAQARLETFNKRLIHKLKVNRVVTERFSNSLNSFSGAYESSQNDAEANTASYQSTLKISTPEFVQAEHFLTGLIEYKDESFVSSGNNGKEHSRERLSYAAEYRGEFANQVSVAASIRHDKNDTFDDFTTYRLSGSWKIPQSPFRLHSSVGTGVVFPSLYDQFGAIEPFFTPNPNLKPEESFGWDAGIEWKSRNGKYVFDITYFQQDLTNEIIFNRAFVPSLVNEDGTSERKGIELQMTGRITDNLSIAAGYTYLDATNPDGTEEVRRAPHSAKLNVNYGFDDGKGNLNLGVNYNGEMKDVAYPLPVNPTLDDYVLVSLAGSYKVQPNIELFGRVENLLDQDYEEIFGYETPGINAYAGVKIKLGPVNE